MTDDLGALMRAVHPDAEANTVPVDPPRRRPLRVRRVRGQRHLTVVGGVT